MIWSFIVDIVPVQFQFACMNDESLKKILYINKLASLEATLVRNSAHPLTHLLTDRGKV